MDAKPTAAAIPLPGLSLRMRLTLWMLIIFVALQFTSALVVLLYQRASFDDMAVARVQSRATLIEDDLRECEFRVTDTVLSRIATDRLRFSMPEATLISVYEPDGVLLASSRPVAIDLHGLSERRAIGKRSSVSRVAVPGLTDGGPLSDNHATVYVNWLKAEDGRELVLLVAITDHFFETLTSIALQVLTLTVLAGAGAAAIAAWVISGIAIAPLNQLRRIAGSLAPESLEQPVETMRASREAADIDRELLDVRAKLLQALRAQDRFISNVSHELKTPISVVLTEAQTLDPATLSPDARDFARSVVEEMQRLGRTVESFLTLTKVRGGKSLVRVEVLDANDVAMSAVTSCARMAEQYGVPLLPELAEEEVSPPRVCGDSELLRIMIVNLVRNAIRFSPKGRPVQVRVQQLNRECQVAVRDQGPGVPSELVEAVFDRFVQASEEAALGRGHGLGLSIAQGIAELHGGRISVSNLETGGCEFEVRLPMADEAVTSGPLTRA